METVVLVIHLIIALVIIILVLIQRSEGGGLGIGGSGGGLGGFASARGTANALTKMTALCAAGFFITSLTLAVLASGQANVNKGFLEDVTPEEINVLAPVEGANNPGIEYIPPQDVPDVPVEVEMIAPPETVQDQDGEQGMENGNSETKAPEQ
ncbi:MAG: preprotein translocase subunit SecG [Alphaproteobacteria bacterium]|nr:preprotein translocase subunit SecG [Alphaproteobacteria bacterium]